MRLTKGSRVLAVLPAQNKWIVMWPRDGAPPWACQATVLVVTQKRRNTPYFDKNLGAVITHDLSFDYVEMGAGDGPNTDYEFADYFGVFDAVSEKDAIETARLYRGR